MSELTPEQAGVDRFDYSNLAEEDTTVRIAVTFYTRNAQGGTTPHAIEVVTKGKNSLDAAIADVRRRTIATYGSSPI